MTNLNEYLKNVNRKENDALPVPSSKILANGIMMGLAASPLIQLSNSEASAFSHKISELATSTKVVDELSKELGAPKCFETEDQFVDRAKSTLTSILKRKLSK